ncbi:hypothetical protein [Paenisporosarcina sp. OV554]|uniref:hypothetical protein n=1 Tax=Paenisporosarcina sp. OV554 TaxID=2135694 RepID=UPI000D38964C|nr:hypothetical protein [Paenisporosarcina sp. OV554]PUB12637.1 hypothetical protein C8K15_109136 [Paenisporosarcina sp. OV554]
MATTYKTLHFHQLSIYKRRFVRKGKEADFMIKDHLTVAQVNLKLDDIISNKTTNNCISIQKEFETDSTTLEILQSDDKFIFARMGKEKDMRAYHLREERTFKAEQILKRNNQIFEVFTYLLIDRETLIISYLHEMSAPSILRIGELFTNLYNIEQLFGEVASVSVEDAIPFLSEKDSIGTVTFQTTLPPSDSKLWNEEITGLDRATYESIENLKSVEITVKLVAERNKDTFPDKSLLGNVLRKISSISSKVKVKAKNENELNQEHLLINNPLTKKVSFNFNKDLQDVIEIQTDIYNNMVKVYNDNKKEVLKYCKVE